MGEILDLLFPQRCIGCSQSHGLLCARCSKEWGLRILNSIDGTPLISSAHYSSSISQIVLRAKEDNDVRARRVLANAIALHIKAPSVIVPIPSSGKNIRRRGYDHSFLLASYVADLTGGVVWKALSVNRKIKDQTKLNHLSRFSNLAGAYSLNVGNEVEGEIVLIDDLVTTGASMKEALRVLRSSGSGESRFIRAVSACIASHHLPNTITP